MVSQQHFQVPKTKYSEADAVTGGPPVPGRLNPFDPPDDFFRIRLIATILETCGMFFNRGAAGKKLDYFLSFFQVSIAPLCTKCHSHALRHQYYVHTKASLPMEIEFVVQDILAVTRPQWKLAASLEEATKAFQLAIAQDQKTAGADKAIEPDEATSGMSSEDENGDVDDVEPYGDGEDESASEEDEVEVPNWCSIAWQIGPLILEQQEDDDSTRESDFNEEAIIVTRQEESIDTQDEADFEREYARMMAESLESRKFERKQLFDVPLPVRPKNRDPVTSISPGKEGTSPGNTMAFSLLTKRGNRQQVWRPHMGRRNINVLMRNQTRTVELPSDSTFAIAMKSQQQAEKEEQQRIKNLVLNYDLQQSEDQEGRAKGTYDPGTFHRQLTFHPEQVTTGYLHSTRTGPRSRVRIGARESESCS